MARQHLVSAVSKGIPIGSGWANSKGGYGISLMGKVRDANKELVDVDSYEIIFKLKNGNDMVVPFKASTYEGRLQGGKMLLTPRRSKREGKKDSDMILYAYPDEETKEE